MTKIAYNACFGGFGLSKKAEARYRELAGITGYLWLDDVKRHDPLLIQVIEELGDVANGNFSNIQIRELPAGTKYRIDKYDGNETVMTIDEYEWETA